MSDEELSPVERLKQQMSEAKGEEPEDSSTTKAPEEKETPVKSTTASKKKGPAKKKPVKAAKKPAKKKAAAKKPAPAKKPARVAKKKGTAKKAAPTEKPAAKKAKAPAKKAAAKKAPTKKAPVKAAAGTTRSMVRDRKGDGLTPIERKIIKFIADSDEPLSVVTIGRRMYGKDCPSEGSESFRTVRNALRFPVKYGMVDAVKGERGLYKIGAAYKRSKGNLEKLAERYRARVAKERKAS